MFYLLPKRKKISYFFRFAAETGDGVASARTKKRRTKAFVLYKNKKLYKKYKSLNVKCVIDKEV